MTKEVIKLPKLLPLINTVLVHTKIRPLKLIQKHLILKANILEMKMKIT